MLNFASASVRIANTGRATEECIDTVFPGQPPEAIGVVIVNAAIGHKLENAADSLRARLPGVKVVGTSCGGVVGREGAGEALTHIAIMAVSGPESEYAVSAVDDFHGENAYEKSLELAGDLKGKLPEVSVIYLVCPGLDTNCDLALKAFDEIFGEGVVIFGGTSADNYKAVTTMQYVGDHTTEHGAWAVGFADETLKCATKASHGFVAYGEPMTVTRADGNKVIEIDGKPAWAAYSERLSLIPEGDSTLNVLAAGGLAKQLPAELAEEYGSSHILRGALIGQEKEVMYMSVSVNEGDKFWLTTRDEALIFSEQEKALRFIDGELGESKPVAVFQTDCLARGRTLFNRVMKDELIGMMHDALSYEGDVPPWLGMYGFGEFCPLGGKNTYHTYTTSLMVLYRD